MLFIFNISCNITIRPSHNILDWAAINDKFRAMNTSMVYGERIGCTIESSWKLVDCVRKGRSFGELANIEFKPEIGTWPWAPGLGHQALGISLKTYEQGPQM